MTAFRQGDGFPRGSRRPVIHHDHWSRFPDEVVIGDVLHLWDEPAHNEALNSPERCVADTSAPWHRFRRQIDEQRRERTR